LLGAWKQVKDDWKEMSLLIAGVSGQVFQKVNFSQPLERVHFLGYVEDCVLAGLYANATVAVLPSQEEGFGLPALEAMACGAPIVVSDGGALPQVVGEAGMIFPLSDPVGLTHALKRVLREPELRADLREKGLARAGGFSWQTTAELVWKNLNE
jgi:glycosyltransferase involved in cell wall biosynthesis